MFVKTGNCETIKNNDNDNNNNDNDNDAAMYGKGLQGHHVTSRLSGLKVCQA